MNYEGLILGAGAFLCIGFFHPLVIKAEYYFGVRSWWAFLFAGLLAAVGSLLVNNVYVSIFLGIFAFSFFGLDLLFDGSSGLVYLIAFGHRFFVLNFWDSFLI